ncbi:MAG TPA: hypothetical protein VK175_06265 [Leadbetterella sp.]|nr:hypothetical protein [Leadbetterella sp.]
MSGLGDFDQKKFELARSGRKLETALEMLKTMEMPEPQKKIAIVGDGLSKIHAEHICREISNAGMQPIVISVDSVGGPDMRRRAMIMEIPPDFSFLEPTPMRKMQLDLIEKVGEAGMRRPIFDFLTERHDGNAWKFTMTAREAAPGIHRGLNLDSIFFDEFSESRVWNDLRFIKLPRKAKKAYIAKFGRVEYRKRFKG